MLRQGFVPSLCVTVPIFVIELVLAITIALLAAYFRDSWLDRSLVFVSVMGMSVSALVYIMVAQYWLASEWRLFPVWGFESPYYLILPVVIGVVAGVQAICWHELTIVGKSAHAGTTPMSLRADAGVAAARINMRLREMVASGRFGAELGRGSGLARDVAPGRLQRSGR